MRNTGKEEIKQYTCIIAFQKHKRIFKILNEVQCVHPLKAHLQVSPGSKPFGMLMDIYINFDLTTEAALLFVRLPCINCYGGCVILYVTIFTGLLEVRCHGRK